MTALSRMTVAVFCALVAGGCTSLRRVQPVDFFRTNSPDIVWVTYPNNTVVPVVDPQITGDTLKGRQQGSQHRLTIPLDGVKSVEVRARDKTKTAVFLTALGGAWVSAVYFLWVSKAGPNPDGVRCGYDVRGQPLQYC
jgi:hypothetical protein